MTPAFYNNPSSPECENAEHTEHSTGAYITLTADNTHLLTVSGSVSIALGGEEKEKGGGGDQDLKIFNVHYGIIS